MLPPAKCIKEDNPYNNASGKINPEYTPAGRI